jgi:hypothetical protein
MKKLILLLLVVCLFVPVSVQSATVTFAWDAPVGGPAISGYKLYWGTATRTYTTNIDVGNVLTYTWSNLDVSAGGTYYSAATAYIKDTNGKITESGYSNEVTVTYPKIPGNYKITILINP